MSDGPDWLFDEDRIAGVDYADEALVEDYDEAHGKFRDFEKEAETLLQTLQLPPDATVLDIGCGTGGLSIPLAKKCGHVYAVDISRAMVAAVACKAEAQGIGNITPVRAGFLTYEHTGTEPDAIICNVTLHHLPDFWKQVALCRSHEILKPGGRLYVFDVVFDFPPKKYAAAVGEWLSAMQTAAGPRMVEEAKVHIKEEYSTWDWILEGMIERAGFSVDKTIAVMPLIHALVCSKYPRSGENATGPGAGRRPSEGRAR